MKAQELLGFFVVVLLTVATNFNLKSQSTWFPDGATWYYTEKVFWNEGYHKLYYEKDTIIHGLEFKSLSAKSVLYDHLDDTTRISTFPNIYQLRADSNVVYWYHNNLDTTFVLYDFNSEIGDLWIIPPHPHATVEDTTEFGSYSIAEIIEIDFLEINNEVLKRYHISNHSTNDNESLNYYLNGPIIERIGSEKWPFPYPLFIMDMYNAWGLRCYKDNEFPLHNFDPLTPCDFTVNISDLLFSEQIVISPNPTKDKIRIECNECCDLIKNLTISSLQGNVVKSFPQSNNCEINIESLSTGSYLLRFSIDNKIYSFKIIKI